MFPRVFHHLLQLHEQYLQDAMVRSKIMPVRIVGHNSCRHMAGCFEPHQKDEHKRIAALFQSEKSKGDALGLGTPISKKNIMQD